MKVYETDDFQIEEASAVSLGNFDGVHLGHQELIKTVKEYSKKENLKSVIFSFYPHPVEFFGRKGEFVTMLSLEEKKFIIEKMGADVLVLYPFNKNFSTLSPENFMDLLLKKTNCKVLVVGENYCFGKDRVGNLETLKKLGAERGINVIGISSVKIKGVRVSSTRIRGLINYGDMETVAKLLNKPYFVMGKVVHGDERGRLMNFPTANLEPPEKKLLPPDGVYFTSVIYKGKIYYSISNVGTNPTFGKNSRRIETNIFDFNEDIYGEEIIVCFHKRIRNERKFKNIEELVIQLEEDKKMALCYINDSQILKYSL